MEIRVIGRGALAGLIAGVLGFVFSEIFAEPVIGRAIDYESGRDDVIAALREAAGMPVGDDGPDIFSRTVQSTIGAATGIVGLSIAMGLLVAVAYLVLHGRFSTRPPTLAWQVAGFGFFGIYLLPFVKYPANPPAIGHEFTVATRSQLYLLMVGASIVLLALAVYLARVLMRRWGLMRAVLVAAAVFLAAYGLLIGLLPSLGELAANVDHVGRFGFAAGATETPAPIINVLDHSVVVAGQTYGPGQIVYPGFDADLLWQFRWYSLLNQMLVWLTIALTFGGLVERLLVKRAASAGVAPVGGRDSSAVPSL